MNIRPVGAELFHADGQTDTTKLIVAFREVCKRAKQKNKEGFFFFFCEGAVCSNSTTILVISNEYTTYMMNITSNCRRINKE